MSGPDPLVSVIVPTLNVAPFVAAAIGSLQRQTVAAIEIIVVDDGSTDGTREIVAGLASSDPRVRLELQEHRGVSAARNRGLDLAVAPYVALGDGDDISVPERLELELRFLVDNPDVAAVGAGGWRIGSRGRRLSIVEMGPRTRAELRALVERHEPVFLLTSSVLASRDAVRAVGGFSVDMEAGADLDLFTRLADRHTVLALPHRLVEYRIRNDSISSTRLFAQLTTTMLVQANAARRHAGLPELDRQTLVASLAAQPFPERALRWLSWRSRFCYRKAGALLSDRRPMGLAWLTAAFALQPLVPLGRIYRQLLRPHLTRLRATR